MCTCLFIYGICLSRPLRTVAPFLYLLPPGQLCGQWCRARIELNSREGCQPKWKPPKTSTCIKFSIRTIVMQVAGPRRRCEGALYTTSYEPERRLLAKESRCSRIAGTLSLGYWACVFMSSQQQTILNVVSIQSMHSSACNAGKPHWNNWIACRNMSDPLTMSVTTSAVSGPNLRANSGHAGLSGKL